MKNVDQLPLVTVITRAILQNGLQNDMQMDTKKHRLRKSLSTNLQTTGPSHNTESRVFSRPIAVSCEHLEELREGVTEDG